MDVLYQISTLRKQTNIIFNQRKKRIQMSESTEIMEHLCELYKTDGNNPELVLEIIEYWENKLIIQIKREKNESTAINI